MANKITLSFKRNTPKWVKITYRIIFAVTTFAAVTIAVDPAIDAELRTRIMLYLKGIDVVAYFLGQSVGVKQDKPDTDNPLN